MKLNKIFKSTMAIAVALSLAIPAKADEFNNDFQVSTDDQNEVIDYVDNDFQVSTDDQDNVIEYVEDEAPSSSTEDNSQDSNDVQQNELSKDDFVDLDELTDEEYQQMVDDEGPININKTDVSPNPPPSTEEPSDPTTPPSTEEPSDPTTPPATEEPSDPTTPPTTPPPPYEDGEVLAVAKTGLFDFSLDDFAIFCVNTLPSIMGMVIISILSLAIGWYFRVNFIRNNSYVKATNSKEVEFAKVIDTCKMNRNNRNSYKYKGKYLRI